MSNDSVDVLMSDGRLFHACGPATANALMVERRVEGTTRSADDTERRRRRAVTRGSNPDFRINPDPDPDVCWIASKTDSFSCRRQSVRQMS